MSARGSSEAPTTRRYTPEEKAQAVRMVRTLRAEPCLSGSGETPAMAGVPYRVRSDLSLIHI